MRRRTPTFLSKETPIRRYLYIDAFAGAGIAHLEADRRVRARQSAERSERAAAIQRIPFHRLGWRQGRTICGNWRVTPQTSGVYNEDCNSLLLGKVFTRARYGDYHRALCLLDPYALNLDWEVVQAAGQMKSIEVFLNFMVMDMNMNVLWKDPDNVPAAQLGRMDAFWGDRSWRHSLYKKPRRSCRASILRRRSPTMPLPRRTGNV